MPWDPSFRSRGKLEVRGVVGCFIVVISKLTSTFTLIAAPGMYGITIYIGSQPYFMQISTAFPYIAVKASDCQDGSNHACTHSHYTISPSTSGLPCPNDTVSYRCSSSAKLYCNSKDTQSCECIPDYAGVTYRPLANICGNSVGDSTFSLWSWSAWLREDAYTLAGYTGRAIIQTVFRTETDAATFAGTDGILGLATGKSAHNPLNTLSITDILTDDHGIAPFYSLCLTQTAGVLYMGEVGVARSGQTSIATILYTQPGDSGAITGQPSIAFTSIKVADGDPNVVSTSHALLDSASALSYLPASPMEQVKAEIKLQCSERQLVGVCEGLQGPQGPFLDGATYNMTVDNIAAFPDIVLNVGDEVLLTLSPTDYIMQIPGTQEVKYSFQSYDKDTKSYPVLGQAFFRAYFLVFRQSLVEIWDLDETQCVAQPSCPSSCGAHGSCNPQFATCDCTDGYSGSQCSVAPSTPVSSSTAASNPIKSLWHRFLDFLMGRTDDSGSSHSESTADPELPPLRTLITIIVVIVVLIAVSLLLFLVVIVAVSGIGFVVWKVKNRAYHASVAQEAFLTHLEQNEAAESGNGTGYAVLHDDSI